MARSRSRTAAAVLVALMAVLAGCGGAAQGGGGADGGSAGGSDVGYDDAARTEASAAAESGGSSDDVASTQSIDSRALVRTGQVAIEVDDFERTEENLTRLVDSRGGYVSDSRQRQQRVDEQTYLTGTLVLRVPNDRFAETFEDVQREGEVLEASTSTEDVTEQLVDIEARLSNLRAQRDRLRTLYDQANDTEAVLQVERRLSEVQTEIERLEARQQSLERRVAFSTITVEIREERPDRLGVDEKWYDIGFVGAFLESVNGVVVAIRAGVVLLGYALPYLLVLSVPFVVLGGVLAWWRGWRPFRGGTDHVSETAATDADGREGDDDPTGPPDAGTGAEPRDETDADTDARDDGTE